LQYFADKGYCTYSYESVMGKGHISIVADKDKEAALHLLMEHYHPNQNAYFNPAAIPRTLVYKLTVEEMTGKRKILKK
ncbi:MAG: pyridoxamine 5'-phosphate oxidase family protein, partial [Selenomonadaceae bacterium]|nr:pyridoxamine 5'-phosphate oxidase family protein [Selenomonadaceae bacterium]